MEKKFYIFGAGKNGKRLLSRLGGGNCAAFIDNDEKKQGCCIEGVECISIVEAINRGALDSIVLVSALESRMIKKQLKEHGFRKVFCVARWLNEQEYFKPVVLDENDYTNARPFNYYDSPYPDMVEIHNREKDLFDRNKDVLDIDFDIEGQLTLMQEMAHMKLLEWPMERDCHLQRRYYYNNSWFAKGSADALYYMIHIAKPKTIVEVGSGYSTAVMLDTNEACFHNEIKIISIEPNADRLKALLKPTDNIEIYEKKLQEIPVSFFEILEENDILFIDSSHVAKMGSDVNYLLFEILPRLKKGIFIHFHDMFYPFIYPESWVYSGMAYNELYMLRAFLMNNKDYSVQLFGDMLWQRYAERMDRKLEGCGGGSLWIKKV